MNRRSLFSALLAPFLVCPALGDTSPSVNSNAVSNTYTLPGWLREEIDYLTPTNAFSDPRIPSAAAAAASAQLAAEIPQLYTVATNTLTTNLAPIQATIAALRTRPVALMTGAAGLDNILDRQNLTLAVVSNEITHVGNKKHVKAWVAANKLLRSAPIMKARVATLEGDAEWIDAQWENYGVSPYRLDFVHPQSYTNFVIATTTNEQTVIITTNVTFEVIEDAWRPEIITNEIPHNSVSNVSMRSLVGYYDAKENAGWGVHDNAATSWVNLMGISEVGNFALSGGTWGSDYLQSPDSAARFGNSGSDRRSFGTVEALIDFTGSSGYCGVIQVQNYSVHAIGYIGMRANNTINFYSGGPYVSTDRKMIHVAVRIGEVSAKCFINGQVKTLTPGGMTNPGEFPTISIGGMIGKIKFHLIRFHKNELTDDEIIRNYKTDANRYLGASYPTDYEVSTNYVHYCVTNTTTKTLTLTNQVLVVMEGAQPRIVTKGDRETLDAYALSFDVPDNVSTNLSVDLSRWIRVGDPEKGFDFGNRQLRVNGSKTITTNDCSFLGEFETVGGTSLTNYFNIFLDNGTFKLSEKEPSND